MRVQSLWCWGLGFQGLWSIPVGTGWKLFWIFLVHMFGMRIEIILSRVPRLLPILIPELKTLKRSTLKQISVRHSAFCPFVQKARHLPPGHRFLPTWTLIYHAL